MKNDKKLISLKQASEISGYSSDYIGQLIRSGKIFGEQVYSNVVWMTTEEAVLGYKNKSKNKNIEKHDSLSWSGRLKRKINLEINIIKIFFKTFRSAFILLLFLFILATGLMLYVVFSLSQAPDASQINTPQKQSPEYNLEF